MVPSGSTCGCDIRLPPNAHWRLCPTLDYERGKSKHSFAPFSLGLWNQRKEPIFLLSPCKGAIVATGRVVRDH